MNLFSRRALVGALAAAAMIPAAGAQTFAGETLVDINTSAGLIRVRVDARSAPLTVKNFLSYVSKGHYEGTIFHRVIDGFMIQGGGFTADMKQKPTADGITCEARGTPSNKRGTIAMARTSYPHSATSQFFINLVDNEFLDARNSRDGWGYAVFGRVVKGMDVVDRIGGVKTGVKNGMSDVPLSPVTILSVKVVR